MNLFHNTNTNQACAACKYQRKKCAPDCILAPYFPHDRQRQFLNSHKLFGVKKITKIIKHVDPLYKDLAMRTIIYQSDIRASDPVGGCLRYIEELRSQIEYHQAELEAVLQQLAILRAQAHHHHHRRHLEPPPPPSHYQYHQPLQQREELYVIGQEHQNGYVPLQEDVNTWEMQDSMPLSSLTSSSQNNNGDESSYVADELYNDQKSSSFMLDIHYDDERNEIGFEPEELVDRSEEAVQMENAVVKAKSEEEAVWFKMENAIVKGDADCIQQVQVQDHDLKGAATLFTLTNCTT